MLNQRTTPAILTEDAAAVPPDAAFHPKAAAFDDTSLAHFCAFIEFYTRQCHDPFSTSLTCAKQAEALRITPEDVSPDTLRQVVQTMLSVVDHLEKKWLDEQIRHEERMQRHREDVARLSQQLRALQREPAVKPSFARRGLTWLHQMVIGGKTAPIHHAPRKPGLKRREALAA